MSIVVSVKICFIFLLPVSIDFSQGGGAASPTSISLVTHSDSPATPVIINLDLSVSSESCVRAHDADETLDGKIGNKTNSLITNSVPITIKTPIRILYFVSIN